jgi:hypothetical protein
MRRSEKVKHNPKFLDPNYKNIKKKEARLCAEKLRQEVEGEAPQGFFSSCTVSGGIKTRKSRMKQKLRKRKLTNRRF